jgi:hypothetical protein
MKARALQNSITAPATRLRSASLKLLLAALGPVGRVLLRVHTLQKSTRRNGPSATNDARRIRAKLAGHGMQGHATQKQERKKMDVITPEYRIGPIVTGQQLGRWGSFTQVIHPLSIDRTSSPSLGGATYSRSSRGVGTWSYLGEVVTKTPPEMDLFSVFSAPIPDNHLGHFVLGSLRRGARFVKRMGHNTGRTLAICRGRWHYIC